MFTTIERVRYATVGRTEDQLRVQVERGVRWVLERYRNLLEQYRTEGAGALVHKARLAAAQLLMPPDAAPRSSSPQGSAPPAGREDRSHHVMAGMYAGVALRDLNLVDALLAQLESMEASEVDPETLARLYHLDHLAARLRRNDENLRVFAGHDAGVASAASPLVDVIRAAMSSIEQYRRIEIRRVAALAVVDFAADDLSRLLAELLDNAASNSPPTSKVTVSAQLADEGTLRLHIDDAGIGLPADRLEVLNARLSAAPRLDSGSIEHMGLAVVRRLASKHGIRVRLDKRAVQGTTTTVLLPADLLSKAPATPWFADTPAMKTPPPAPVPVPVGGDAGPVPSPRSSPESAGQQETPPAPRTTRNGLPRRIPQSLREFASFASTAPRPRKDPDSDPNLRREQLVADLDDFFAGERAARDMRGTELRSATAEGSHDDR